MQKLVCTILCTLSQRRVITDRGSRGECWYFTPHTNVQLGALMMYSREEPYHAFKYLNSWVAWMDRPRFGIILPVAEFL